MNIIVKLLYVTLLLLVAFKTDGGVWAAGEATSQFRDFENYRNNGAYEKALVVLEKLLSAFMHEPLSDETISFGNAKMAHGFLLTVGLPKKANELNDKLVNYSEAKYGPQSIETKRCKYFLRARTLIDLSDYKKAKDLLRTLSNDTLPNNPFVRSALLFHMARCEIGLQNFDDAYEYLQEATGMATKAPQDKLKDFALLLIEAAEQKGVIKRELKDYKVADDYFRNALDIHKQEFPKNFLYLRGSVFRNSGLNNERRHQLDDAILDFEKMEDIYKYSFGASHNFVIEANFHLRGAHLARGVKYKAAGDIKNALLHYQKCIDYDDNLQQLQAIQNDSDIFFQPEFNLVDAEIKRLRYALDNPFAEEKWTSPKEYTF